MVQPHHAHAEQPGVLTHELLDAERIVWVAVWLRLLHVFAHVSQKLQRGVAAQVELVKSNSL